MEIEQKIWDIWVTHPSDRKLTEMLSKGSYYMSQNRLGDAYIVFTEVIALDDKWAEAWNKRATVLYLMGEYEKSQKDIDKVLSLEKDILELYQAKDLYKLHLKIIKRLLIVILKHIKYILQWKNTVNNDREIKNKN